MKRALFVLAMMCVGVAANGMAAQAQGPLRVPQNLEEADQALDRVRRMVWAAPDKVMPDGSNPAKDVAAIVLTEQAQREITAARAAVVEAIKAGISTDSAEGVRPYSDLVMTEMARGGILIGIWQVRTMGAAYLRHIEPLLQQASLEDRAKYLARMAAADAAVVQQRKVALGPNPAQAFLGEEMSEPIMKLMQTYSDVRAELMKSGAAERIPPTAVRARSTSCDDPVQPKAADSDLSLKESVNLDDFYPLEMQMLNIEGVTGVEIVVSSEGCVTQVRTVRSSGVLEMDVAAEKAALGMRMYPASKGGKAIEAKNILPVRFKLH